MTRQIANEDSVERIATEAQQALISLADPTYGIGKVVKTDGSILGVRVPKIRALAATICATHPELDLGSCVSLMSRFAASRGREEMLLGIFILAKFKRQLSQGLWPDVSGWVERIDNWEVCDQLASNVAGPIVAKNIGLVDDLAEWSKSTNLWRRRFAVATATMLNQQGRSYPHETLRVCEATMRDPEPMVQKAVGWAIREATEHDPDAVFAFLNRHKASAQRRILREGSEKFPPTQREALLS